MLKRVFLKQTSPVNKNILQASKINYNYLTKLNFPKFRILI